MTLTLHLCAPAPIAVPPVLVKITVFPDTVVVIVPFHAAPPAIEHAPPAAAVAVKSQLAAKLGAKVIFTTPFVGIALDVVKLTVAVPVAPATKVAGVTLVELKAPTVMVLVATAVSWSIAA